MQIAIAEAKAKFAALIRRAAGEQIELARYGRPVPLRGSWLRNGRLDGR